MAKRQRAAAGDPLWPTQTFTYRAVTITVERQTGFHSVLLPRILAALPPPADEVDRIYQSTFARAVAQSVEIEGLDVAFPETGASPDEWRAAYDLFLRMAGKLLDTWYEALQDVDRAPNAQEFWPTHRLTEDERKNLRSAGRNGRPLSGATSDDSTSAKPTVTAT